MNAPPLRKLPHQDPKPQVLPQYAERSSLTFLDRIATYDDPEAFVRRVAFNLAKNQWRRVKRTLLRASPPDRADATADPAEHQDLVAALLTLSIHEREAIVLHYLAGQSIDEIAKDLSVPTGTVKSWLARGRVHLAQRLSVEDPEEMTRRG